MFTETILNEIYFIKKNSVFLVILLLGSIS